MAISLQEGQPCPRKGDHEPVVRWNVAEKILMDDAKGDVLVIMDACFGGNLKEAIPQRDLGRAYEFLAACPAGQPTAGPGPKSFTSSVISCLKDIVSKESSFQFTIPQLLTGILEYKERQRRPPAYWTRSSNTQRSIRLAPLPRSLNLPGVRICRDKYFSEDPIPQYLNLRIELKDLELPNQAQIEELARNVSRAVKESSIRTRRVDYLGIEPKMKKTLRQMIQTFTKLAGTNWWKSPKLENDTTPAFENPVATLEEIIKPAEPQPSRKRGRSTEPADEPTAKRRQSSSITDVVDFAKEQRPLTPNSASESTSMT